MSWRERLAAALVSVPSGVAVMEPPQKAVYGAGAVALQYSVPLWSIASTPQRRAYQAAALYRENYLIRLAENPVSQKGGSVPWHLEDENDDAIDDENGTPAQLAIRDLLEKPQAALPLDLRQPGMETRRGMWSATLRHMGLCGTTFWFLDQTEALAGTPLAILYVAPWRLFEVRDPNGRFLTWSLDKPYDEGGELLKREDVLPFHLQPPDQGVWASGLVEAAGAKAALDPVIDRHILQVIGSGGRLTGLLSPKVGSVVTDDNWQQFIRDYRAITQDNQAALKLQIVQGPVDYTRTSATLDELQITDIDERTRDAILGLWGVPRSQVGIAAPAGLNSGSTKGFDEAILWQGAIHPRLQSFWETVQYGLLDRYKATGTTVELVLEEPEYDDDTPLFQRATNAASLPLTDNERRAMVGFDPLPEWDQDTGEPLGIGIWRPINQTLTGMGKATEKRPTVPEPVVTVTAPPQLTAGPQAPPPSQVMQPAQMQPGKATLSRFTALRRQIDRTTVGTVQRAVQTVLDQQKAGIVRYLRTVGLDHLRKRREFNWTQKGADDHLEGALRPVLGKIVHRVAAKTHAALATGKADLAIDDFTERVVERVLTKGAGRVRGINQTTREAVQQAIATALEDADTIDDVIAAVEGLPAFGPDRAEVIARTESMFAYNSAALGSYQEMGVAEVEAIDGDGDEECAARDGQVYSVEEAAAIEDHPNGTLDWLPIVPDEPAGKAAIPDKAARATRTIIEYDEMGRVGAIVELEADL